MADELRLRDIYGEVIELMCNQENITRKTRVIFSC